MRKTIYFILIISLLLINVPLTHAQEFEYEGTYLTTDQTQHIEGFHFDQVKNRIIIIPQEITPTNHESMMNMMRIYNAQRYVNEHIDLTAMTKEEVTAFNAEHDINYQKALRTVAHSDKANDTLDYSYWDFLFLMEIPGVHTLGSIRFMNIEPLISYPINTTIINQPDIHFNQDLWEVSLFDIKTPILRFEAGTNTQYIKDDYGILYEKQDLDLDFDF